MKIPDQFFGWNERKRNGLAKATDSALLQMGGLIDFVYKVPYRTGTSTELSNILSDLAGWVVWELKNFTFSVYFFAIYFAGTKVCLHMRGMPQQGFSVVFIISHGLNCIVQTH